MKAIRDINKALYNLGKRYFKNIFSLFVICVFLSACSSKGRLHRCYNSYDHEYRGSYKIGLPYKIKGITYHPKEDHNYDEIGLASWYGDDFQCKPTSNGEIFNKHQLSAAHKTLPLPSVAKVTDLNTGKSIKVIINDRGPFVEKRIIDLSERSAKALGVWASGVAKVRVQYLKHDTENLLKKVNLLAQREKKRFYIAKKTYQDSVLPTMKATRTNFTIHIANYKTKKEASLAAKKLSKFGLPKLVKKGKSNKYYFSLEISSSSINPKRVLEKVINLGFNTAHIKSS